MRRIAVEEHFRLEMNDLGEERLRDMFDAGIDVQVLLSDSLFLGYSYLDLLYL